jgi:arylsulfatase A-like enzyme
MPATSGIYNNGHWWRPHLPNVTVLPKCFKLSGYHVIGGGKVFHHTVGFNPRDSWHQWRPWVQDEHWNFTYPVPGEHQARAGVHWPQGYPLSGIENVRLGKRPPANWREFDWGPLDKDDLDTGDGQLVRWAVEQLKKPAPGGKPLFLAAGIFRPHLCWYAPRKYFDMYPLDQIQLPKLKADDLADVPPAGRKMAAARTMDFELVKKEGQYKKAVQAYLACISFADALVGRLLDALAAGPHAKNTLVVLWSDHGWHLGEKEHWHKMTLWERSTRVPFLLAGPGIPAGGRCERPVGLIDIYPTLVDLCGLKPPSQKLDGTSLTPLLKNPAAKWNRPALTTYLRGNHTLRDERWRYIRYATGGEELYDHQTDPHEWTNLAADPAHAAVKKRLAQWLPKTDAPNAPSKGAYRFDPKTYTWKRKAR